MQVTLQRRMPSWWRTENKFWWREVPPTEHYSSPREQRHCSILHGCVTWNLASCPLLQHLWERKTVWTSTQDRAAMGDGNNAPPYGALLAFPGNSLTSPMATGCAQASMLQEEVLGNQWVRLFFMQRWIELDLAELRISILVKYWESWSQLQEVMGWNLQNSEKLRASSWACRKKQG